MAEKKIFISADIEGITDVTFWSETEDGGDGYAAACAQMTREVAAACEAVIASGYRAVVRDGHGNARNISHIDLPEQTELMRGWACHPGSMMAGIDDSFSGAIYIGYHAPAGSKGNPLAHTVHREKIRWVKINDCLASEFTMNALYAASFGVPSLFLSGDQTICDLAKEDVPSIATLAVKRCRGNSSWNMHPLEAVKKIKRGVGQQIEALEENPSAYNLQPLPKEFVLEVCLTDPQNVKSALNLPGVKRVDDFTVRYIAHSPEELNISLEQIMG